MEKFWNAKGKRILAFLLAILTFACSIPNVGIAYAEETDVEENAFTVSGTVKVPGYAEGSTEPYVNAKVSVVIKTADGTGQKEVSTTTGSDGTYSISVTGWNLVVDEKCVVTVAPADDAVSVYNTVSYAEYTVVESDVTSSAISMGEISLTKIEPAPGENPVTHTVAAACNEGGVVTVIVGENTITDLTNPIDVEENATFTVKAEPLPGYRVSGVTVTPEKPEWDSNPNWWIANMAGGIFSDTFTADADYDINVSFVKTYTITATGGENGSVIMKVDDAPVVGTATVDAGKVVTIEAEANFGNQITDVTITKVNSAEWKPYDEGAGETAETWWTTHISDGKFVYALPAADGDYNVNVSFELIKYNISTVNTGNGTVEVIGGNAIDSGSDATIVATPDANHSVSGVTITNVGDPTEWWKAFVNEETGIFTYVIPDVTDDYEVNVTFVENAKYEISANVSGSNFGAVQIYEGEELKESSSEINNSIAYELYEGNNGKIVIMPKDSAHEIISLRVTENGNNFPAADAAEDWWKDSTYYSNGVVTLQIEDVQVPYAVEVEFAAIPKYTLSTVVDGDEGGTFIIKNGATGLGCEAELLRDEVRTIVATAESGYEIVSVRAIKGDDEWIPEEYDDANWWEALISEVNGVEEFQFTLTDEGGIEDYTFVVKYAIKKVTVQGSVTLPGGSAYTDATVTINYNGTSKSGVTDENGAYSISIDDWNIKENDSYTVKVILKDDGIVSDELKYYQDEEVLNATDSDESIRILTKDIELQLRKYTISWIIGEDGKVTLNGESSFEEDGSAEVSYKDLYTIVVSVTDNTKHLTSVQLTRNSVTTEKLTEDDLIKGNDLHEKEISLKNGLTSNVQIEVTIEIDKFDVEINTDGEGTVVPFLTPDEHFDVEDGKFKDVEYGAEKALLITPGAGKQVAEINVVDSKGVSTPVAYSDAEEVSSGCFKYVLANITDDLTFEVKFIDIPVVDYDETDPQFIIQRITDSHPENEPENAEFFVPTATNKICFGNKFIIKVSNDADETMTLFVGTADNTTQYKSKETVLDGSIAFQDVNIRDAAFGTQKVIRFRDTVTLSVDNRAPEINESQKTKYWLGASATEVGISGIARDEKLDYVLCSTSADLNSENIADAEGVKITTANNFSMTVALSSGNVKDVFYLYAVDKAGNCSVAKEVIVYRDGVDPQVSDSSINVGEGTINKKPYGNFYNGTVTFTLTAKDVPSGDTDGLASGLSHVVISIPGEANQEITAEPDNSGNYTFVLNYAADDKFTELKELSITLVDICGNEAIYKLHDLDSSFTSNLLKLESAKPTVVITPNEELGVYDQEKDWYWYKKDAWKITYQATDAGTGIAKYEAYVVNGNGKVIADSKDYTADVDNYDAISKDTQELILASSVWEAMSEGENTLRIEFTDLAGNVGYLEKTICLDNHTPRISKFDIELKETGLIGKLLSYLFYGNYSNGNVIITVTADDVTDANGTGNYSSVGLDAITLYLDEEAFGEPVAVDEDGKATFSVPVEEVKDNLEKIYLNCVVNASVTDKVGNTSEKFDMTTGNSNIASSELMIENIKPVITLNEESYFEWGNTKTGNKYSNDVCEFNISVIDHESGLRSVTININGTVKEAVTYPGTDKTTESEATLTEQSFTVTTEGVSPDANGLYIMTATVVDNAGNESEATQKVYFDNTAPQVSTFEMKAKEKNAEMETGAPVTETDYGFYFHAETEVFVTAIDGTNLKDSGVKEIAWYRESIDGTKTEVKIDSLNTDGKMKFTVPAGFKGQVYACAYDQLGNHSTDAEGNPVYVHPNGVIVETEEQHKAETDHIVFSKPAQEAPYADSEGNPLYNKKAFDDAGGKVDFEVVVKDTFSGIETVTWDIVYPEAKVKDKGTVTIDNTGAMTTDIKESSAENKDNITWQISAKEDGSNLVTEVKGAICIKTVSNNIAIKIKLTDRAGNTSEVTQKLSIDTVVPEIKITFDGAASDAQFNNIYRTQRTATITVIENNFKKENFKIAVTNTDGAMPSVSNWGKGANANENVATVTFTADGDYTMEVSGKDIVGNAGATQRVSEFTIDMTVPTVTVSYANNNALNNNYYAETQTATIEVHEHNFEPSRINVIGTATTGGAPTTFPTISGWSSVGDVHTATLTFASDALYRFDVELQDKAGNVGENFVGTEFYVDMTAPEIEITGVENMSANNGEVIPRVILSDSNYNVNGVTMTLRGANRGDVNVNGSYSSQGNGQIFTFANFPEEQEQDDIYTLSVALNDMAGNETTDEITFSVNRFGSVYVFDDSLKEIAGTYVQEEIDVRLTEVNVDSLEHETIRVVVDANGTLRDLEEGTDYTVEENGGNGSWYQYDYVIDKSLFAGDGRYIVTLYSEDIAGNVNANIDEEKKAEISFGIDKTAPVVIPIDIASNEQYDLDVKSATVTVNDNLVLENVQVYVDEEQKEFTSDGENYVFDIPSSSSRQDVTIVAKDAAGNTTNYVISGVLVTTNAFIRWYNNTPLFIGSIVGVAGLSGASIGGLAFLKNRNVTIKTKKKKK